MRFTVDKATGAQQGVNKSVGLVSWWLYVVWNAYADWILTFGATPTHSYGQGLWIWGWHKTFGNPLTGVHVGSFGLVDSLFQILGR